MEQQLRNKKRDVKFFISIFSSLACYTSEIQHNRTLVFLAINTYGSTVAPREAGDPHIISRMANIPVPKSVGKEDDLLLPPHIIPRPRYELVLTGDQDR